MARKFCMAKKANIAKVSKDPREFYQELQKLRKLVAKKAAKENVHTKKVKPIKKGKKAQKPVVAQTARMTRSYAKANPELLAVALKKIKTKARLTLRSQPINLRRL